MTATEMAVHSALMKQGDNARALVDTEKNIKSRAASLGLFSDKLSFAHFFTKKVDISVNNTRFKGKRGHQVRGGVVPITTGLVADYNPAVMRADKNRDAVKFETNNEKPQIIFVDRDSNNRVSYLPVKVDRDASVLEQDRLVLKSTEPYKMVVKNRQVLSFDGFEVTEKGLSFSNPRLSVQDPENDNKLKEVDIDSAKIGISGVEISPEVNTALIDEDTDDTTLATDSTLANTTDGEQSTEVSQILASQSVPKSADIEAPNVEAEDKSKEGREEAEITQEESRGEKTDSKPAEDEGQSLEDKILDTVLDDELGILETIADDLKAGIKGETDEALTQTLITDIATGMSDAVGNVLKNISGDVIGNETIEGHVENAIDTVNEVANHYLEELLKSEEDEVDKKEGEEEEDEKERDDADEEISISEFIIAFIDGDTESVAGQRIEYAKKMLKTFKETGKWEDTPDDETLKLLHLQTSDGDADARKKVNGYEFEGSVNILPWLYGFASFTPSYALKVDTDYELEPEYEVDPVKLAESVATNLGIGHTAKKGKEEGEAGYNARIIHRKEQEKLINAIIASVKISAGVSVALMGSVGVDAKLGLGVGNPFLFGAEGYIGGGLKLAGNADKNDTITKLSATQELTLEELAKEDGNLLSKKTFGDTTLKADIGLGINADVNAAARIRSRLLSLDYELAEFLSASYNLASINYTAEFKRTPGGKFFGFEPETAFSAKVLGASLKKNSVDGKYGFSFDKKESDMADTMEILNRADSKSKDIEELFVLVEALDGKEETEINLNEIGALIGKLKIASYEIEKLMKASAHSADILNGSEKFQKELLEARTEVEKHNKLLGTMQEWADLNSSKGLEDVTEGAAYDYYMVNNGGDKSLDKERRKGIRDEVITAITTRDKLLDYETKRLISQQEESDSLLSELKKNLKKYHIEDANIPNKEFTSDYMDITYGVFDNGINDSLSLYADPQAIRDYEKAKIALETKKHTDRMSDLNEFMAKNSISADSESCPELARYYVKTLGATNLKKNLAKYAINMDNVLAYEEGFFKNEKVEQLVGSYNILNAYNKQYESEEDDSIKSELLSRMNEFFVEQYGEEDIRDKAYRMYGADELMAYEEGRADKKYAEAIKQAKNKDGSLDLNKLLKMSSSKAEEVIKDKVTLEELMNFELTNNHLATRAKNTLKNDIIDYRYQVLKNAVKQVSEIDDPVEREKYVDIVKNDYFSGELDRQAIRNRNSKLAGKKSDEKLHRNNDFINAYKKDPGARNEDLDRRVLEGLEGNIRDNEAAKHIARIENIQKMKDEGKTDVEIYQEYKNGGATQFMSDIQKEYKTKSLSDITPEQMIRFAAYKLHKNTRANFFVRSKRYFINFLPIFGAGVKEETIEHFEREGHFGRWERLVELRDSDEFKEMSPKEQNRKLHKFYSEELLGGRGLQSALEDNYENVMTPKLIFGYEQQRMRDISLKRNKRLEALKGKVKGDDLSEYKQLAENDGEGIGATFKWLWKKLSGNYTIDFDSQANAEEILSPANIIDYETRKKESVGKKHQERIKMLEAAEEMSDKEVYEKYVKMGGGNGFLSAHSIEIKLAEKELMSNKYNDGKYSFETIMEYEKGKKASAQEKLDNTQGLSDKINGQYSKLKNLNEQIKAKVLKLMMLKNKIATSGKGN